MLKSILDHGYLKLIETWGSDESIIEAARMSTGKGFLGWEPGKCPICNQMTPDCNVCEGKGTIPGDKKLLARLWNNYHGAQWEIRQYALAMSDLIAERFPRSWALFNQSV